MQSLHRLRLLAIVLVVALYGSCQELDVTAVDAAAVEVTPAQETFRVGEMRQFQARVEDAAGNALRSRRVSWSVADAGVARVDDEGRVTGLAPGATRVIASVEGASGEAQVTIMSKPVAAVEIQPPTATLPHDGTLQLQVTLRAADGSVVTGPAIGFVSEDPLVATVDAAGLVRAAGEGTTRITATAEGRTAQTTITVQPAPVATIAIDPPTATIAVASTATLRVVMLAADGRPIIGHPVTWTSDAPANASVDAGRVTGVSAGSATITATAGGKSAQARVTVTAQRVASVTLQPANATLFVGESLPLVALVAASDGAVLTGRPIAWTSLQPQFATVDAQGVVEAVAPGTARIIAVAEGIADTATVFVIQQPVYQVSVQPPTATVAVAGMVNLTAVLTAADGTVLNRPVAWASADAGIARVDGIGRVTGVSVGTTTITAVAEGKSGSATVTVSPQPVASVEVAPPTASLAVGDSVQLHTTLRASDGTILTGRQVAWRTSDPAIATVDAAGMARAVGAGTATITATSENVSGTAMLTVSLKPVAKVTVAPDTITLFTGETVTLAVTLQAADGTVLTGRTVSWASSAPTVATPNPASGASTTVTTTAPGTATLTATSEGVNGTATVTVRDRVASVTIVPDSVRVAPGAMVQFRAELRSASGALLTARPIAWQSSDANVFALSSTSGDIVSGVAGTPGTATLTATAEGIDGTASVVVALNVGRVAIAPTPVPDLYPGGSLQLTATVFASDGSVLTNRPVTWTFDAAVLALTTTGTTNETATIRAIGTPCTGQSCATPVSAAADGTSNQVFVNVLKPVATIVLSPASPAPLDAGSTLALSATLSAADGTTLTGRTLAWASLNPGLATVNPATGVVTAASDPTCAAGQQACGVTIRATAVNDPANGTDDVSRTIVLQVRKRVASVTVTPPADTVTQGGSRPYQATVRASDGTTLTGHTIDWSAAPAAVADVSPTTGNATTANGRGAGVATITATVRGTTVSGNATLTVRASVTSVSVIPPAADVYEGGQFQLTATALAGTTVVTGRNVTWSATGSSLTLNTSGPDNTTVSVTVGALTCTGTFCTDTITATVDGVSQRVVVTMRKKAASLVVSPDPPPATAPGGMVALAVTALRAADNTDLLGTLPVVWSSLTPAIASVDPASGVVTIPAAVCPQQPSCAASIEARVRNDPANASDDVTTIVVVPVVKPIAQVVVTPANPSITLAGSQPFTASVLAADGTTLTGHTIDWSVQPAGVVTLNPTSGAATTASPVGLGSATVTATAGGVSGSATIDVATNVARVAIAPANPAALFAGESVALTATAFDASNAAVTGRPFAWAATSAFLSLNTSGADNANATVDAAAPACGAAVCNAVVSATLDGVSAQVTVTVKQKAATVAIAPSPVPSLLPGQTVQLGATVHAADQTDLSASLPIRWTSTDGTVAAVDPTTGLVTAVGAPCPPGQQSCTATIRATVENSAADPNDDVFAEVVVTVLKPVATVEVTPQNASIAEGGAQPFQATVKAADGTVLTNRTIVWSSAQPNVATVNPLTGPATTATAVGAGTTTINATVDGTVGSAALDVLGTVTQVDVAPSTVTLFPGASAQLAATAMGSGGVITGRMVTWGWDVTLLALTESGTFNESATIVAQPPSCAATESCATSVTATVDGVTGNASVTVLKAAATVTVSPPPAAVLPGGTVQLSAALAAGDGTPLTGRNITWTSLDPTIATVDPASGLVTALAANCAMGLESCDVTIRATAENDPGTAADDVSGDVVVSVLKPVGSVVVTPNSSGGAIQLYIDPANGPTTQVFTAEAFAVDGTPLTNRTITWTIVTTFPSGVATIDMAPTSADTTTVTAKAQNGAEIRASAEGVDSAIVVIVIDP